MDLEIKNLYRMPWSKNDNPHGWIEVTTFCNMACSGCYRGCDRKDNVGMHKSVKDVSEEIEILKKIRNCHTVSISGGEPLLHPNLFEIVGLIRKNGFMVNLFTNGKLLDKKMLIKLKRAGLTSLIIGIDSFKNFNIGDSEKELNKLRQKYADMVYDVGDIGLTFTCVVDKNNLNEISDVIEWFFKNGDKVDIILLLMKGQVMFSKKDRLDKKDWVNVSDVRSSLEKSFPDMRYCAFLGSELENADIKWLWSFGVYFNEKIIGYCDKKMIEGMQMFYHLKKDRYFFIPKRKEFALSFFDLMFFTFFSSSARDIIKKIFFEKIRNPKSILKKPWIKIIMMLRPPRWIDGKRDFCDACPDATLYNGKLVPSCGLEEVKRFGRTLDERDLK
jgi:hypothetical protein